MTHCIIGFIIGSVAMLFVYGMIADGALREKDHRIAELKQQIAELQKKPFMAPGAAHQCVESLKDRQGQAGMENDRK